MKTVAFTQPYVPAYRVPLFDALYATLREHDIDLVVYSGTPHGFQALRNDSASGPWHVLMPSKRIKVARWTIDFRTLPKDRPKIDLLVSELDALNLLAWRASFNRRRPLVLWGHGKAYVNDPNRLADLIEWALVRRSSHVMTYSEGGRAYLINNGKVPPAKVTAIGNSTDTKTLRSFLEQITPARRTELVKVNGVGPRALYVGGLDASKRIDFLLAAAAAAAALDPTFRLHIVGEGELADVVLSAAESSPYIRYTPVARGRELAELASTSDALWMPGRVGLVAVDALALGLPVHTIAHDYHAPEVEFLQPGEVEYLQDNPAGFGSDSLQLIRSTERSEMMRTRSMIPSVEAVSKAMEAVIMNLLDVHGTTPARQGPAEDR